ncbi:MAG: D-tyrosyl-tRNA(Tyr) deacylase [Lentisphaeria bacterium]|nr:D-tyrosyl-tRNA(Tyr) deacylase [Lentisphaeria bacterium]
MRALLQRVSSASVTIDNECVGKIGPGLVILLGITETDDSAIADWVADKSVNLRIFNDADDKMNLSALDTSAEILIVSQFTLYGDCDKGRRPSFVKASRPDHSKPLYEAFVEKVRSYGLTVATGVFAADMLVQINNDGPVTLMVEKENE